jgi:hypothetical protein
MARVMAPLAVRGAGTPPAHVPRWRRPRPPPPAPATQARAGRHGSRLRRAVR